MAGFSNPDRGSRCELLGRVRNIAVVGLSPDPSRPSYGVSAAMQRYGFNIIPVHPAASAVLGAKAYPALADVDATIDLVNVFRAAQYIDGVVDECLALKLPAMWIQLGIYNEDAAMRAQAGGMMVVMNRCIYVDYRDECRAGT